MQGQLLNLSWQRYLAFLFLFLGLGLLSSGITTWIASNWESLTKFQKIYSVQGLLTLTIILSVFIYPKEIKKTGKLYKTNALAFISSISIGGLFTLIGQVYQSGADTWQVFAVWSLFQLPLFIVFPNLASGLLLVSTLNLTAWFFTPKIEQGIYVIFILNLILLAISEWKSHYLYDPWRVVPRLLTLIICVVLVALSGIYSDNIIFFELIFVLLLLFYNKRNLDLVNIASLFCSSIIILDMWLFLKLDMMGVYIAIILNLGLPIFISRKFYPKIKLISLGLKSKWSKSILHLIISVLIVLQVLAIIATLNIVYLENLLVCLSIISFVIGICFLKKGGIDYSAIFLFISLSLITIYLSVERINFYREAILIGLSFFCIFIFLINKTIWLRIYSLLLCIFLMYVLNPEVLAYTDYLLVIVLLLFILKERIKFDIKSMAWSLLLTYMVIVLYFMFMMTGGEADALPEIHSFIDFFHLITKGIFIDGFLTTEVISNSILFTALLFIYYLYNNKFQQKINFIELIAFLILGLCFFVDLAFLFSIALLLVAYSNRSKSLFFVAILFSLFFLSYYYYDLAVPLLYKSFLLLSCGLIFSLCGVYLTSKSTTSIDQVVNSNPFFAKKSKIVTACLSLISILSFANHLVIENEDILENGEPLILELAPRDPRSIMQGDYMELNYVLLDEIYHQLPTKNLMNQHIYVLFNRKENNIVSVCRIEFYQPTNFSGCESDIYLPIKMNEYQELTLPTHQFFFPEGKAHYFSQATYGEYRFKNGKALLARLLDKELKAL